MDIRISGHQMETGAALQDHATDRLEAIVEKYFSRAISSHVMKSVLLDGKSNPSVTKNVAPNPYSFSMGATTVKCDRDESSNVRTTSLSGIGFRLSVFGS